VYFTHFTELELLINIYLNAPIFLLSDQFHGYIQLKVFAFANQRGKENLMLQKTLQNFRSYFIEVIQCQINLRCLSKYFLKEFRITNNRIFIQKIYPF